MFGFGSDNKIDEVIKKIEEFAKDTDQRLDNLEKVAIANDLNLQRHMSRSDQLEELVKLEKEERKIELNRIEKNQLNAAKDRDKINKHINMVEGGLKLMGILSLVVGIIVGFAKLFGFI